MTDYVIVGMGAAGFSAAEVIRQVRPEAALTIVSDEPDGYYSRPGLAYVLTGEVPERQLFPVTRQRWKQLNARLVRGRAVSLRPETRQLTLANGQALHYDVLLLATGASAIPLDLPDSDAHGVVAFDSISDTREIMRQARHARSAVVVGGGITALEIIEGLCARKVPVHYLMRGDRYWRNVLDESEAHLIEERLVQEGVVLRRHTEIARVLSRRNWRGRRRVSGVETDQGEVIPCQIVGVAIGVRPRLDLTAGTSIRTDRGILVNQRLETNVPGVYAAGDVAQVYDPLTGRAQLDVLWPLAVAQGRVAGANMARVSGNYQRQVPYNVARLGGILVALMGAVGSRVESDPDLLTICRGDSEVWRGVPNVIVVHERNEINRQRLLIKDGCVIGAVIMGDQSFSPIVYHLIRDRVDIEPYLRALQSRRVGLAQVLGEVQSRMSSRGIA